METKICNKCNETKDIELFGLIKNKRVNKENKLVLYTHSDSVCKLCRKAMNTKNQRKIRKQNEEKYK